LLSTCDLGTQAYVVKALMRCYAFIEVIKRDVRLWSVVEQPSGDLGCQR
jgi:hypothetical protein